MLYMRECWFGIILSKNNTHINHISFILSTNFAPQKWGFSTMYNSSISLANNAIIQSLAALIHNLAVFNSHWCAGMPIVKK